MINFTRSNYSDYSEVNNELIIQRKCSYISLARSNIWLMQICLNSENSINYYKRDTVTTRECNPEDPQSRKCEIRHKISGITNAALHLRDPQDL